MTKNKQTKTDIKNTYIEAQQKQKKLWKKNFTKAQQNHQYLNKKIKYLKANLKYQQIDNSL